MEMEVEPFNLETISPSKVQPHTKKNTYKFSKKNETYAMICIYKDCFPSPWGLFLEDLIFRVNTSPPTNIFTFLVLQD